MRLLGLVGGMAKYYKIVARGGLARQNAHFKRVTQIEVIYQKKGCRLLEGVEMRGARRVPR